MRKLWYAGAMIASGMILFGAATPAQAGIIPDVSGMPPGGTIIPVRTGVGGPAKKTIVPKLATPKIIGLAKKAPRPAATPVDPRLHEEPVDNESSHRPFTADSRPIAGVDEQYR